MCNRHPPPPTTTHHPCHFREMRGVTIGAWCAMAAGASPRLYAALPSPARHPLRIRHAVQPPELSLFTPPTAANCSVFCPGFAALRDLNAAAPSTWQADVNFYVHNLSVASMAWPGFGVALSPEWPALGQLLAADGLPVTDLSGFVPGGVQDFDVHSAPNFTAGRAALGPLFQGFDMGEQDVRYLWGYASHAVLPGPQQRLEQLVAFRDFSWNIEWKANGTLVALSSSVLGPHYWLKTGLYTLAGSETSQSNGNAQVLYAFVRGASKQYGSLWYGQVSVYNWFGAKFPGDPSPTPQCQDQSSHSPTCGTSLNLMKRLMYTQLSYDAAYFAFESGFTYLNDTTSITPIGILQREAMAFTGSVGGIGGLGVHVPTIALLLDSMGGWVRPCDSQPFSYVPASWGNVPWDAADYWADAVIDTVWPGYRAGSLMHDETSTMAPTPFGDGADVLFSDAIASVLGAYDTLVVAHRLSTEGADVQRRLAAYASAGGHLVLTASSLADMQAVSTTGLLGNVAVGACTLQPAGTSIVLVNGTSIVEPLPFESCSLSLLAGSWDVLATIAGQAAVASVAVGNGSVLLISAGNYGMTTRTSTGPLYSCSVDEVDTRASQPFQMALFVRAFLTSALQGAALFDLGDGLAWVPKRVATGEYVLTVTNPRLSQQNMNITSRLGPVASVEELALDQSEKGAAGYFPHGFENSDVGNSTNTTIAGVDTRIFRVKLTTDSSTLIPGGAGPLPPPPDPSWGWVPRRLLRLQPGTGDLRRQILARPAFTASFGGVVLDWAYLHSRSPDALATEAQWLSLQRVAVVVDFTSVTTLFPGIRLCNDMGGYYQDSLAVIRDVLSKMPVLGSADAIFALHGVSELPPANFSGNPVGDTAASVQATLSTLSQESASAGITLHLRRTSRNDVLAGPSLANNAGFAAGAGIKVASSLAYVSACGDNVNDMVALIQSGSSTLVLLSSAWQGSSGRLLEGAPLAQLPAGQIPALQALHAAAVTSNCWVVLDAGFDSSEASGRAQELSDVAFLVNAVAAGAAMGSHASAASSLPQLPMT